MRWLLCLCIAPRYLVRFFERILLNDTQLLDGFRPRASIQKKLLDLLLSNVPLSKSCIVAQGMYVFSRVSRARVVTFLIIRGGVGKSVITASVINEVAVRENFHHIAWYSNRLECEHANSHTSICVYYNLRY